MASVGRLSRKRPISSPETQDAKRQKKEIMERKLSHSKKSYTSSHRLIEGTPRETISYKLKGHNSTLPDARMLINKRHPPSYRGNPKSSYSDHNPDHMADAREYLDELQLQHSYELYRESTDHMYLPPLKQRKYDRKMSTPHSMARAHTREACSFSTVPQNCSSTLHRLEKIISSKKHLDKKTFATILSSLKSINKESRKSILLLLQILTSKSTYKRSKGFFSCLFRPQPNLIFFQCISSYVCSVPQEGDAQKRLTFLQMFDNIVEVFHEILTENPLDAPEHLPIDACCGTVEQLCRQDLIFKELEERVTQLKIHRDKIRQESYESTRHQQTIAEDDILPTPEELHSPLNFLVPLKVNRISGPFPSVPEYASTFYSLMRADFIYPLQEMLDKVKQKKENVYEQVSFKSCFRDYINNETICELSFTLKKQIKWQYSKKLAYGNLLCLSEDNFSSVIFATVTERDVENLKNGLLTVKLIGRASKDPCYSFSGKKYTMFESPSYYETYAPMARALQLLVQESKNVPFQNYFVKCMPTVDMPAYLKQPDIKFNLHKIICSCKDKVECQHTSIDVEDIKLEKVDTSSFKVVDQSQLKALCAALTQELVLIQGPPGTGKTYIGLKIVKSFLLNKPIWAPLEKTMPIMIVCYTNHALDQFLEGLIEKQDKHQTQLQIRRVGSRSKSEILKPYNIKNFVKQRMRFDGMPFISRSNTSTHTLQKRIEALNQFLHGHFDGSKDTIKIYSFFLSENIIDEIDVHCDISINLPVFSKWNLVKKRVSIADEIRYLIDRHSDDDIYELDLGYEENSLKKFVKFLHREVKHLPDKNVKTILHDCHWQNDDHLHLQLFKYCLEKLKDAWQNQTRHNAEEYAEYSRRLELTKIKCLQEADVIGLTVSGAINYHKVLTQVKAKICVIEEAAEVLEPHVFLSLTTHIQQLILIGDHKQLRPKTNSNKIGYEYKLEVSLFERLAMNNFPVVTLGTQHRMRPEISRLVSKHVYKGKISDSKSVKNYKDVKGMLHNLFFVDHQELEVRDEDSSSPFNMHEARFIVQLRAYLLKQGYRPEQITIITPYVGQLREIRQIDSNINVSTLDNFQGEENDIILLSMVRSNEEEKVGFTKIDNRVCVAMSRAKIGFYCIGNFSAYKTQSDLWKSILSDLEESDPKQLGTKLSLKCRTHKHITEVSYARDFMRISSGGCGQPCRIRLPICNHTCSLQCHPNNLTHDKVTCSEPCPNRCSENHRCREICGKRCPPCIEIVNKVIPKCGHKQPVPCSESPAKFCCKMDCEKILPCGHRCKLKCGEDCDKNPCRFLVTKEWPCGHRAQKECHVTKLDYSLKCTFPCEAILACEHKCSGKCGECRQGRFHKQCGEKCTRILVCGHPCSYPCAKNCPPCKEDCMFKCPHASCGNKCSTQCKPCPHRCKWKCEHYQCSANCGEPCDRPRCNEPCTKKLKCGHSCVGLCGEPCPKVCRVCNKDDETFSILFGDEDDPESHFIELMNCKHVLEVNALDTWVDDNQSENVDWKRCPRCKAPIIMTLRYANQAKQVLKDINIIKKKEHKAFQKTAQRYDCFKEIQAMCLSTLDILAQHVVDRSLRVIWERRLGNVRKLSFEHFNDYLLEVTLLILQSVYQSFKTIKEFYGKNFTLIDLKTPTDVLYSQVTDFLHRLISKLSEKSTLTDQMRVDVANECRRVTLLREVYLFLYNSGSRLSDHDASVMKQLHSKYECLGFKPPIVSEDVLEKGLQIIKAMSKRYFAPLTLEERKMIIKATQAKKGSWYKCKNGHFYQIGECGGAMQTSKCPECNEVIGGGQHRLAEGNEHAGEFDDSAHAAWSEGANMGNYML